MEGEVSVMESLWTNITTVVSKLAELLGTTTTTLIGNELFQIVLGTVVFGIGMGTVFTLVKKIRKRGK